MKIVGWALIAAGAAMVVYAFVMSVGVASPGGSEYGLPSVVANADLMNQRLLLGVTGSALWLSGWLALILGRLPAPAAEQKATEDHKSRGRYEAQF